MLTTLHILSVGTPESNDFVRDALLSRTKCQLMAAASVWDLSALLVSDKVDVAILHGTLSPAELRSCAAYVRHHWPAAQILLVHAHADFLDDPMYDERIPPGSPMDVFLTTIERLAAFARRTARHAVNLQPGQTNSCRRRT